MADKKDSSENLPINPNKKNLFDMTLLLEIAAVLLGSSKMRQPTKGDTPAVGFDLQKLSYGMAGVAGERSLRWMGNRREDKKIAKGLAAGIITPEDVVAGNLSALKKAGGNALPLAAGSAIAGAVVYVLSMEDEERARLFAQIDQRLDQVTGFVRDLQGKPYSKDFEAS